jgi:hypothetical protein
VIRVASQIDTNAESVVRVQSQLHFCLISGLDDHRLQ